MAWEKIVDGWMWICLSLLTIALALNGLYKKGRPEYWDVLLSAALPLALGLAMIKGKEIPVLWVQVPALIWTIAWLLGAFEIEEITG